MGKMFSAARSAGTRMMSTTAAAATGGAGGAGGAAVAPDAYPKAMKLLHWGVAATATTCVGTIMVRRYVIDKDSPKHGFLMRVHKTAGLLTIAMMGPRVAVRLSSVLPRAMPGTSAVVHQAGEYMHKALYVILGTLSVSGLGMALFSGKPLAFFGWDIKTLDAKPAIAGNSFKLHKRAGQVLEYTLPLHIGGAFFHALRGEAIFARINPFLK